MAQVTRPELSEQEQLAALPEEARRHGQERGIRSDSTDFDQNCGVISGWFQILESYVGDLRCRQLEGPHNFAQERGLSTLRFHQREREGGANHLQGERGRPST